MLMKMLMLQSVQAQNTGYIFVPVCLLVVIISEKPVDRFQLHSVES